jgi:uncharacterized protein
MTSKELPPTFVCPIDRTSLVLADDSLLARLNRAIAAGRVKNQAGRLLDRPLDAALLRADHALVYPVLDDIPVLLADEAIPLEDL